jgi:hypothetical protein
VSFCFNSVLFKRRNPSILTNDDRILE